MTTYLFPLIHPTGKVSADLIAAGFKVLAYNELDDLQDSKVHLSTRVHVQVGVNYFNVVEKHPDGETFTFHELRRTLPALIADLRRVMAVTP